MTDTTVYADREHTPDSAVKQIFVKSHIDAKFRLQLANKGYMSVDQIAAIGDTLATFKVQVEAILTTPQLGADGAERCSNLAFLGAMWRKCNHLAEALDTRRSRMEEEPWRVPEISVADFGLMRATFKANHTDLLIVNYREPHKKFIEKMLRDFTIHDAILFYEIGEIRLGSERILTKSGITSTPDQLLKIAHQDEPATVNTEDDALNRLFALHAGLEYIGQLTHSRFVITAGEVSGGAVDYLQELEERRRAMPGLEFIVIADRKFRKKICELLIDHPEKYINYSAALKEVFDNHKYLWNDARSDCQQPKTPKRKSDDQAPNQQTQIDTTPDKTSVAEKRKLRKRRQQANKKVLLAEARNFKSAGQGNRGGGAGGSGGGGGGGGRQPGGGGRAAPPPPPPPGGKGGGKGKGKGGKDRQRVPQDEWVALHAVQGKNKACQWHNMSCGCSFGNQCRLDHKCWECGATDHTWFAQHYRQ